jgi:hypothetical protein
MRGGKVYVYTGHILFTDPTTTLLRFGGSANPKSRLKLRSRFFSKTVVHYRIRQVAATIVTPPSISSHLAEAHHARGGEDDHRFAFLALDLRNEWLHPES